MLRGQQTPAPHSQPGIRQRVWNITGLQKFLLNILYLRTWIFQRKDFRQDPHGASCQYQTTVFQDNRVSPDVIPDTFTHVNKCQDFAASLSNPKQVRCGLIIRSRDCHPAPSSSMKVKNNFIFEKSGREGGYLGNGRVIHTPDGSDSSGFSEKAASSELSCSDYCSNGGERKIRYRREDISKINFFLKECKITGC